MILEIESFKEEEDGIFLTGKNHSGNELQRMVKSILKISDNNFIPLFCRNYAFDIIKDYKGNPDVVIDLDTNLIYRPKI